MVSLRVTILLTFTINTPAISQAVDWLRLNYGDSTALRRDVVRLSRPGERAIALPAASPDDYQVVTYTSFYGTSYILNRYNGRFVALLIPAGFSRLTTDQRRTFIDRADILYQHYKEIMGAEPSGNDLLTIAVLPSICPDAGACAAGRRIEILDDQGIWLAITDSLSQDLAPNIIVHEMGHSFDIFGSYLQYVPDDPAHAWTDLMIPLVPAYEGGTTAQTAWDSVETLWQ